MSLVGRFSTMSMADLIQWARTAQRTGVLTLSDEESKRIQVTFVDGRIVSSATNEQRETYSAYLLYLGLCSDADITDALAAQQSTGVMLASVLVHERKIGFTQAVETLTSKTIEDLCDVFLWTEGSFGFDPLARRAAVAISIDLDPIRLVYEGLRRADVWSRIGATVYSSSFFEPTSEALREGGGAPWEDIRMARRVYPLLDGNTTVADVVAQLPFSRYKVFRAISELLERKLIRPSDVTGALDRERRVARKLAESRKAAADGRWTEAMETLSALASANPGRRDVVDELLSVTERFRLAVYEHHFTPDDVPVVTIGPDATAHMNIDPTEAFIMSRVDGRLSVRQILRITPVSEYDGLRVFKRLQAAKVIDFPSRRASADPAGDRATLPLGG